MMSSTSPSFNLLPFDISILPPNLAVIYRKVCRLLSLRSAEQVVNKLSEILDPQTRKHKYSLRTIEFFLTEYTLRHAEHDVTLQMIYESYQRLVNSYSKKHFDCFARDIRVPVSVAGKTIQTTPAQLHFLQWFFNESIDVEIERRVDDIRAEMKQRSSTPEDGSSSNGNGREKKSSSLRRKARKAEEEKQQQEKEQEQEEASLSAGELRIYAKQVERLRANLKTKRGLGGRGGGCSGSLSSTKSSRSRQ